MTSWIKRYALLLCLWIIPFGHLADDTSLCVDEFKLQDVSGSLKAISEAPASSSKDCLLICHRLPTLCKGIVYVRPIDGQLGGMCKLYDQSAKGNLISADPKMNNATYYEFLDNCDHSNTSITLKDDRSSFMAADYVPSGGGCAGGCGIAGGSYLAPQPIPVPAPAPYIPSQPAPAPYVPPQPVPAPYFPQPTVSRPVTIYIPVPRPYYYPAPAPRPYYPRPYYPQPSRPYYPQPQTCCAPQQPTYGVPQPRPIYIPQPQPVYPQPQPQPQPPYVQPQPEPQPQPVYPQPQPVYQPQPQPQPQPIPQGYYNPGFQQYYKMRQQQQKQIQ